MEGREERIRNWKKRRGRRGERERERERKKPRVFVREVIVF